VFNPLVKSSKKSDAYGNLKTNFSLQNFQLLEVTAISKVRSIARAEINLTASPVWESCANAQLAMSYKQQNQLITKASVDFVADVFVAGRPLLEACDLLSKKIHRKFIFDPTATTLETPVEEIFALQRGVCQDFARVAVACLKSLGIPVRYVSGYVDTQANTRERRIGGDLSHAWFAVYCPVNGWIDFDPTNNRRVGQDYITLAWGDDYIEVAPVTGSFTGGQSVSMDVSVDMQPLDQPVLTS
jgi:transglutaminase-like putative cysteine protease